MRKFDKYFILGFVTLAIAGTIAISMAEIIYLVSR